METLREAIAAVQRNPRPLALYAAIAVMLSILVQIATTVAGIPVDDPNLDPYGTPGTLLFGFAVDFALLLAFAVVQPVVFSRMGKEIDRPLWKISGDWEAIRRYFLLWLVLDGSIFVMHALVVFAHKALENDNLTAMLFILTVFLSVINVPVGAAVMFGGRIELRNIDDCLRPLFRQMPRTLGVLLFAGIAFFFSLTLREMSRSQQFLWPLISIVDVYFNCVLFAATWFICIFDRQNPEETDLDF